MPTYRYRCDKCGDDYEVVQTFADAPLQRCRTCKGKIRRVFGNVGIVLKGSGFYKTDSRSGKSAKLGGSKTEDSKSSEKIPSDAAASSSSSSSSTTEGSAGEKSSSGTEAPKDTGAPKKSEPGGASSAKSEPKKAPSGKGSSKGAN